MHVVGEEGPVVRVVREVLMDENGLELALAGRVTFLSVGKGLDTWLHREGC